MRQPSTLNQRTTIMTRAFLKEHWGPHSIESNLTKSSAINTTHALQHHSLLQLYECKGNWQYESVCKWANICTLVFVVRFQNTLEKSKLCDWFWGSIPWNTSTHELLNGFLLSTRTLMLALEQNVISTANVIPVFKNIPLISLAKLSMYNTLSMEKNCLTCSTQEVVRLVLVILFTHV